MNKTLKVIGRILKLIYKLIDKIIVIPISRMIYRFNELIRNNSGKFERILNRPNVLLYISLISAISIFILIDSKAINLVQDEAEILSNQPVKIIYNKEAYIVEGVPETVDITLIGRKSDLYLAKQLGEHEAVLDLSSYSTGTYKVRFKYNHSIDTVNYKLDPSTITVKISEKVSAVKALSYDLLNEDKLDNKLNIEKVVLDRSEVIVKSSAENLTKIAKVKALIDLQAADLKEKGSFTVDSNILVAYDSSGNIIDNIEIVPAKISASVTVSSYSVELPVKVVTSGNLITGYAISSITSSVSKVTVYGDEAAINKLSYIEAKIDIEGLDKDKNYPVTLVKPAGIRHISETNTSINVQLSSETSKEFYNIPIESLNLGNDFAVSAVTENDRLITVIAKGVESILNNLDSTKIKATIDLSGYTSGIYDVEVNTAIDDVKIKLIPKVQTVQVKIVKRSS